MLLLTCCSICDKVHADNDRKKVAVVLSGGGAKGMAHIGVLKVIQKAGIPVDIITGTSMGSIVGGLYSVGWNANELDSLVRGQDWLFLLSDRDEYYSQNLLNREKQNTYFISKTLTAKKNNISGGGGFIQGINLSKLLGAVYFGDVFYILFAKSSASQKGFDICFMPCKFFKSFVQIYTVTN